MNSYYPMIFKRKSFHLFKDVGTKKITKKELKQIQEFFDQTKRIDEDIAVSMRIFKEEESTSKRGAEYCLCFYSEVKDNYLVNIGYLGEQIDLFCTSLNIGTLWYGIGRVPLRKIENQKFIIMILIKKIDDVAKFRKDMFTSKRKPIEEIWQGKQLEHVTDIVRFTPSACNIQPWFVKRRGKSIWIYRYKKEGKRGIIPINKVVYFNQIDIGIFLYFFELCFEHEKIAYQRTLYIDDQDEEYNLISKYTIE